MTDLAAQARAWADWTDCKPGAVMPTMGDLAGLLRQLADAAERPQLWPDGWQVTVDAVRADGAVMHRYLTGGWAARDRKGKLVTKDGGYLFHTYAAAAEALGREK